MTEKDEKLECLEPNIDIGPPFHYPLTSIKIKRAISLPSSSKHKEKLKKGVKEKRENKFDVIHYKVKKVNQESKLHLYKNHEKEKKTHLYGHWTEEEHDVNLFNLKLEILGGIPKTWEKMEDNS